jgi:hypothetical protein
MKVLGVEINDKVYQSNGYNMYVSTDKSKQNRDLTKTYYIKDKNDRLTKVRSLLKGNDDTRSTISVTTPELPNWQEFDFKDVSDFLKKQNSSMFLKVWSEVSNKRKLEIEVYAEKIFNESEKLENDFEKICYLIDQQYNRHKGVFDHPKSDFLYCQQYNELLYDIFQNKINEVSKTNDLELRQQVKSSVRKPLVWSAQKNSIGTLFGVLYKNGIIKGHKTDIVRGLSDMFDNLSSSSLTDNVNLKVNVNEAKSNYDKTTTELLNKWIEYLEK